MVLSFVNGALCEPMEIRGFRTSAWHSTTTCPFSIHLEQALGSKTSWPMFTVALHTQRTCSSNEMDEAVETRNPAQWMLCACITEHTLFFEKKPPRASNVRNKGLSCAQQRACSGVESRNTVRLSSWIIVAIHKLCRVSQTKLKTNRRRYATRRCKQPTPNALVLFPTFHPTKVVNKALSRPTNFLDRTDTHLHHQHSAPPSDNASPFPPNSLQQEKKP